MSSDPRPQEVQEIVAAFKKSITKWENVVLSAEDGRGIADCGLRELFWTGCSINTCVGCPVMEATGKKCCRGSPYAEYEATLWRVDDVEDGSLPESEGGYPEKLVGFRF